MTLPRNMGTIDRFARAVLGLALVVTFGFGLVAAPWSWLALGVGGVLLATAAVGYCPLYSLFGLVSCPLRK